MGYHITLTDPYNASVIARKTTAILTGNFLGLKKFHKYDLTVEAFNSVGSSPKAFTSAFTDEDGKLIFHLFCLSISWTFASQTHYYFIKKIQRKLLFIEFLEIR